MDVDGKIGTSKPRVFVSTVSLMMDLGFSGGGGAAAAAAAVDDEDGANPFLKVEEEGAAFRIVRGEGYNATKE